jgi:tRNA U34 5-carboxymethylaminomethyl modifying enzyme MnmG/GidA
VKTPVGIGRARVPRRSRAVVSFRFSCRKTRWAGQLHSLVREIIRLTRAMLSVLASAKDISYCPSTKRQVADLSIVFHPHNPE